MVWELKTLRPFPPLAQCHLLATTKRCDRPKNVTPVMGLEPATLEPHANRQRTELRLGSRARLSPSTTSNKPSGRRCRGSRLAIGAWDALPNCTPRGARPPGVTRLI